MHELVPQLRHPEDYLYRHYCATQGQVWRKFEISTRYEQWCFLGLETCLSECVATSLSKKSQLQQHLKEST